MGTSDEVKLRPAVRMFAQLMERKLRKNDHKGGWKHESESYLLRRMREEVDEVALALMRGEGKAQPYGPRSKDAKRKIADEAADVANFALMLADVVWGGLCHAD